MATSQPTVPPPPPRTVPQRFQSMKPKLVAGMAAKVRAPAVQDAPSPIQVIQGSPTEELTEDSSSEPLTNEVPPVAARPSKPRQVRSRPTASQIARVPKQPIRLIKSREAFHLAAQAKHAISNETALGGEVQHAEVAREPPRSLSRRAAAHEELKGDYDSGAHEELEGNHVNDVDDNQVHLEMDDCPSQNEGEQEGEDDWQLASEGTRRRPKHKSTSKISKSRVRKKKKKHGQRPDQLELATERLTLEADEDSSDEENTQAHFRILSRPKRRKPENLCFLDESEFRMPKVRDAYPSPSPSPCSDGFVGKEASPIGLVMQVRGWRPAGRSNSRGQGKTSTLRMGELVIGKNRHQDERKLRKKLERMPLPRKPQTPSGGRAVGLEDDPIQTATSAIWKHEQEDENVFEISEQIPEQMMIDSDTGASDDHVSQIIHNNDSENCDYRTGSRLLTPSIEHTNSTHVPLIGPEHIQEENKNVLLVAAEEPLRPDLTNTSEPDEAPDEETPNTSLVEEVTNGSDNEIVMVDMVKDEGKNEAETDDNEVDMIDEEGKDEAETDDNEVNMVVDEGRIETETSDGKNTGVPREKSPTWSETYTERTDTESGSDCDAPDESSVQDSDTSSEKSYTSDDEEEALSESSEQMRDSDEEAVAVDDVVTAVALERDPNDDPSSDEEFGLATAVPLDRAPTEDPDSEEEVSLEDIATTIAVEENTSQDTDSDEEVDLATDVLLERAPTENPDSHEDVDLETAVPVEPTLSQDPDFDEEVDFDPVATTVVVRSSIEEVDLDDVAITDSDEELDLDEVAVTVAVERRPSEDLDTPPEESNQKDDEIMVDAEPSAEEDKESLCNTFSELDEEPVIPIEQVLVGSIQEFPIDIYERYKEHAEDALSEEAPTPATELLERNETTMVLSEETPKVIPEGDGDEAMLLLEDHVATENNSLVVENQRLRSLLLKFAGSYLEAPSEYLPDESILVEQGAGENSSAIIENQRLEELSSEIADSYQQSQPNDSPDKPSASNLQEKASEALLTLPHTSAKEPSSQQAYVGEVIGMPSQDGSPKNPGLSVLPSQIPDSFPEGPSSDSSAMVSAAIPQKKASEILLQHPQSEVNKPKTPQTYIEETTWYPKVPHQSGSMEIEDDQIVDSPPPFYRRTASRRKSSVVRTKSLTIVRARPSPGPEADSQGLGLSSLSSGQINRHPRPIRETMHSQSREAENDQLLEETNDLQLGSDIHSSQLDFVPDVGSYFSRASQDLDAPVRRSMMRSKSMFAPSSSRFGSQPSENSSQASYNPEPSQPISMATSRSFSRLPTLCEGGEKPKLQTSLTRKSTVAHGTTPNTGKKRMISLPFTPPFKKPEGNQGSVRR